MKKLCGRAARWFVAGMIIAGYLPVSAGIAPTPASAQASPVITDAGCNANLLPPNDDGSSDAVTLPFSINFFGNIYTQVFVNNNGNITFDNPLSTFTPFTLDADTPPIIAPFFGDVDTRSAHPEAVPGATPPVSNPTRYGVVENAAAFGGRDLFCVNWRDVGYYSFQTEKLNDFQLLLVDRGDRGPGDFDIYFNYNRIIWETGNASGGSNGLGGTSAGAGFSSGTGDASGFFELGCSLINGACLDSNTLTGLRNTSTAPQGVTPILGRHIFSIRQGSHNRAPVFDPPTPADGTVFSHGVGGSVTFDVAASDPDESDTVSLSILGMPPGATFTPTAGNPATGTFTWPSPSGRTILTLLAQDQLGLGALQRSITILAQTAPEFIPPTPADGSVLEILSTDVLEFTVKAEDENGDIARLASLGLPAGATYTYVGTPGSTSTALFRWAPGVAAEFLLVLTTYDNHGNYGLTRALTLRSVHAPAVLSVNPAIARLSTSPVGISGTNVVNNDVYVLFASAFLEQGPGNPSPGTAIAGRTVKFFTGSTFLCQGVSRTDGMAFCQGDLPARHLNTALNSGYRAVFEGDTTFLASTGTGAVVQNAL